MSSKNLYAAVGVLLLLASATAADCRNSILYVYEVMGVDGLTMVNLTSMSSYVDANLTHVDILTGQDVWRYDPYRLIVNTTGDTFINLSINDFSFVEAKTVTALTPDTVLNPTASAFKSASNAYTLNFYFENGSVYNYGVYSSQNFEIICDSYSPASFNPRNYNLTTMILGVKEAPIFRLTADGIIREQKITDSSKNFNFYIPQTKTNLLNVDYNLKDYVGVYGDSILHLQRAYNDIWLDVDSRKWDNTGDIKGVRLFKDQYYRVLITKTGSSQDKGLFKYTSNGTQDIKTTQPLITYGTATTDGLTHTIWQNTTTQRLYCYYNVDNAYTFTSASFTVYNYTGGEELYTVSNETSRTASFSYLIPDTNLTYKVDCTVNYQMGQKKQIGIYGFRNESQRFMGPQYSATPLGYSWAEIFTGASIFLVVFILGFASKGNGSYIALLGVAVLWMLNLWAWITIEYAIISFLLILAALYRFRMSREGAG